MNQPKYLFLFLCLLFSPIIFCQSKTDENYTKIATVLNNYFDLEREAIHLHLDKTTFINNESIWYQGYITNRKTNKPYFTTNVFVLLFDEKGKQLSEKLLFASNGTFSGKIDLNSKLDSGNYYIQVYTNWMNNFSENESTITKINVINPENGIKNYKKINTESLDLFLNPEGKNYINDVSNIIGVQLKDCRGNAPENIEAKVENSNGVVIKTFKLNRFGLGKFEITPRNEILKVKLNYNGRVIEKNLPNPQDIGYALETNNFTIEGKTIVKIKTNEATINLMQNKKVYLLAHQDQKYSIYNVQTNTTSLEQTIFIDNTNLSEGINTIRIIDSDLKQWAERLTYVYPKIENTISILKNGTKDGQINLVGYSQYQNSSLSVSVLPDETKSWDENNSILAGLTINPYLTEPLEKSNYYFNSPNRTKFYELDLALLNQATLKYDWDFMEVTIPHSNYSFDIGLSLKGTINTKISNKTYHKAKLVSKKDFIMMSSDITEKGDYLFEHILLADSTYLSMSLQRLPNFEAIPNVFSPQVLNRKRPYYKLFKTDTAKICPEVKTEEFNANFDFPKFASNVISLKEVRVTNEKNKLNYENKLGNGNLRGYKIDETLKRQSLLNFIEQNGFTVVRDMGTASIYSRGRSTLHAAQATPLISIDERTVVDPAELSYMTMEEVDEIYLDPYAIVPSMNNYQGMIKIYTKKIPEKYVAKKDPNSFYIKEGYTRYTPFKNIHYENTQSQGFDNYGVIGWEPRKKTDNDGQFIFQITDYNKSKTKIIIEGMTTEGRIFHEEKIVELK